MLFGGTAVGSGCYAINPIAPMGEQRPKIKSAHREAMPCTSTERSGGKPLLLHSEPVLVIDASGTKAFTNTCLWLRGGPKIPETQ